MQITQKRSNHQKSQLRQIRKVKIMGQDESGTCSWDGILLRAEEIPRKEKSLKQFVFRVMPLEIYEKRLAVCQ
jgi:hypothetical protein